MKVAIVGAGGVGGYFGALLARAGHEVHFIARGNHLRAIRAQGLKIRSVHGDFEIRPAHATDRPDEIGPVDLTIFAVKTYDTDTAAAMMGPLLGPQTAVLPLQNGVESAARLKAYCREGAILGGMTQIVSYVAEPGVIRQESEFRRVVLGELDATSSARSTAIRDALTEGGVSAETTDDIEKVLWTKLLFIASFSGLTSVTRAPAGPIAASAESRAVLRRAMREVEAVARGKGIRLDEDVVEQTMTFATGLAPTTTSSMQRDVMAGRRSEYDALNGAIVRGGQQTGVPTPVHEFLWTCLKVVDAMAPGV